MKKLSYLLFPLLIFPFNSFSQEINIEIDKRIFDDSKKSLLLISDDYGNIKFEKELSRFDIKYNVKLSYYYGKEKEKYTFTIYNEYLKEDGYYYKALSYHNVKDSFIINKENEFFSRYLDDGKKITIKIHGIESYDVIYSSHVHSNIKLKHRKELLHFFYTILEDEDLFVVLKCNEEENYKYIYVPNDKVTSPLVFAWEELDSDLEQIEIPLPNDQKWRGTIDAINEDTGYKCPFIPEYILTHPITIFRPQKYFFYDYKSIFYQNGIEKTRFLIHYTSNNNELPTIEQLNENDFDYNIEYADNDGFKISSLSSKSRFYLYFDPYNERPIWNRWNNQTSNWKVVGQLDGNSFFSFPKIPQYYAARFKSVRSVMRKTLRAVKIVKSPKKDNYIYIIDELSDNE